MLTISCLDILLAGYGIVPTCRNGRRWNRWMKQVFQENWIYLKRKQNMMNTQKAFYQKKSFWHISLQGVYQNTKG